MNPWAGNVRYEQHSNRWHSEDLSEREDGWRISGGFLVSRIDDGTSGVTHYEDYTVPERLRHFRTLLKNYLRLQRTVAAAGSAEAQR